MYRLHEIDRIHARPQQGTKQDMRGDTQTRLVMLEQLREGRLISRANAIKERSQMRRGFCGCHAQSIRGCGHYLSWTVYQDGKFHRPWRTHCNPKRQRGDSEAP